MPNEQEPKDAADITGPMGWRLRLNGSATPTVLVMAMACCTMMWIFRQGDAKAEERNAATVQAQVEVKNALQSYEKTQRALLYVISLPQTEREKLNLAKPDVLREMQAR